MPPAQPAQPAASSPQAERRPGAAEPRLPELAELLAAAQVLRVPLRTRFRGVTEREVLLLRGPAGYAEFSPFPEYDDAVSARWLTAAIEYGWQPAPEPVRETVGVNAVLPAVPAEQVAEVLERTPGVRTVKVKVAEPGRPFAEDRARVVAARAWLGEHGRIRLDANGGWDLAAAEAAARELAEYGIDYLEQPVAELEGLIELRRRLEPLGIRIAADEAIRRSTDPSAVWRLGAAQVVVLKVQPLGGIRACLRLAEQAVAAGCQVVVSSALESTVGLGMGTALAAALPELELDCGLGTGALLAEDVSDEPLLPVAGALPSARPEVSEARVRALLADAATTARWQRRLERCYGLLAQDAEDAGR